jgi:hypothetical protein
MLNGGVCQLSPGKGKGQEMSDNSVVQTDREKSGALSEEALLERRFEELARAWKADSLFMSSVTDMVNLPSYQEIIRMGPPVVPLLLRDLAKEPNHWFMALYAITGADPIPPQDRGNVDRMAAAWLRWGRDNGYCR